MNNIVWQKKLKTSKFAHYENVNKICILLVIT